MPPHSGEISFRDNIRIARVTLVGAAVFVVQQVGVHGDGALG